ncbi:GNAT family N-acetyltransferase [Microtetraspora sp. AC03309]|uniref:GNAT family N-acetyltransferase n=1 Tax=Microtetraspora sp. AC03309 TaxID=2779376 RepID=UPI001E2B9E0D|nr:GNAT family N-acetyltransferase [Microtetraspora sp. AC03309]MCC5575676.1 GNAT family N-acetyltransferase [Microtetraspora sp. AC03309]
MAAPTRQWSLFNPLLYQAAREAGSRACDTAAQLSVLTAATYRGHGRARLVASVAVADALVNGLPPQWRARPESSRRVARALGFREFGSQTSLLMKS